MSKRVHEWESHRIKSKDLNEKLQRLEQEGWEVFSVTADINQLGTWYEVVVKRDTEMVVF